jgi:hypothetical protein
MKSEFYKIPLSRVSFGSQRPLLLTASLIEKVLNNEFFYILTCFFVFLVLFLLKIGEWKTLKFRIAQLLKGCHNDDPGNESSSYLPTLLVTPFPISV